MGPRPVSCRTDSPRYLLDLDLDLAEVLTASMRAAARSAATARVFSSEPGELDLTEPLATAARGPGLLMLDGVLAINVRVGDRVASELVGAGDLLTAEDLPGDQLLACLTEWRGLTAARFAVLDAGFADRVRPWPQIMHALIRRVEHRTHNLNVQRAIASQPRLEVRLTLLFWHLASRWGRVAPGGIRLPLPLTHQLLGRLVGAERASVSHALARLSRSGAVTGHGDEWLLHGQIEELLALLGHGDEGGAALLEAASGAAAS